MRELRRQASELSMSVKTNRNYIIFKNITLSYLLIIVELTIMLIFLNFLIK